MYHLRRLCCSSYCWSLLHVLHGFANYCVDSSGMLDPSLQNVYLGSESTGGVDTSDMFEIFCWKLSAFFYFESDGENERFEEDF